ncbi:MAG: hypothetical protein Kow0025_23980 [Thermodesulfovibrionales bacterium]
MSSRKKTNYAGTADPARGGGLAGSATGLCAEGHFREMLCLERKRSERSRKPFLLALVHLGGASGGAVDEVSSALFAATRETDIKGWYEEGLTVGVIFTEMNGADGGFLKRKIEAGILRALGPETAGTVSVTVHLFPEEPGGGGCAPDSSLYPDLSARSGSRRGRLFLKRVMDVAGAVAGIILFSPLFIIIPAIIKLTSRGPVFFRQERVGRFGKRFVFLKFRSMYSGTGHGIHENYIKRLISKQAGEKGLYKIKDDPRVTPVGRFLRKSSLDELPQFFNVLRGDMSLVGPRPPIPYELESYDVWHRRRVLETKPGITGLWQVKGRSSTTFDEMVRMDLKYVADWSLWLDLKIILKTPVAMIIGKGAY